MLRSFTLFAFFLFATLSSISQSLTFDELVLLRSKDLEFVHEYMTKKGYVLSGTDNPIDIDEYNSAHWAYKKSHENKALYWFYYFSGDGLTNIITFQTANGKAIEAAKVRMKALGYKLTDKDIITNGLSFTYQKDKILVIITNKIDEEIDYDSEAQNIFEIKIRKTYVYSNNNSKKGDTSLLDKLFENPENE